MPAPSRPPLTVLLVAALLFPAGLGAQGVATVTVGEENLRREPQGTRLASVLRGTEMPVLGERGRWHRVRLEGWIWAPSVRSTSRGGYDLEVARDGGENLRASPNGEVLARTREGMLLTRLDSEGNWFRVQREAWMWGPSLEVRTVEEAGETGEADEADPSGEEEDAGGDTEAGGGGEAGDAGEGDPGGDEPDREHVVVGERPARLHATPGAGDSAALVYPGSDLEVLAREGEWTRVRLDGWVREPALVSPDSAGVATGLTAEQLRRNPEKYRGRRVRWTVQFVALRRAEPIRTDFREGEPFVLARPPGSSDRFVYLAVPQELLPRVEELEPLQSIEVLARVRTGRSSLMGVPILDLLTLY